MYNVISIIHTNMCVYHVYLWMCECMIHVNKYMWFLPVHKCIQICVAIRSSWTCGTEAFRELSWMFSTRDDLLCFSRGSLSSPRSCWGWIVFDVSVTLIYFFPWQGYLPYSSPFFIWGMRGSILVSSVSLDLSFIRVTYLKLALHWEGSQALKVSEAYNQSQRDKHWTL